MKSFYRVLTTLVALIALSHPLAAVDSLEVNISLTIAADLSIVWYGDTDGAGGGGLTEFATEVAWPIGAAALNTTYNTYTPAVGTGGSFNFNSVYPLKIRNKSNTTVKVEALMVPTAVSTAASTTVWSGSNDGSVGSNIFNLKVSVGAGSAAAIDGGQSLEWATPTGVATTNLIASLANGADSGRVDFQVKTPSAITVGGGSAQRMIVRFTASAIP